MSLPSHLEAKVLQINNFNAPNVHPDTEKKYQLEPS